tara:strand:- start:72 stop:269 length:198 start_codon:yes stop_codon:yes gene_type:complete
MKTCNSANSIKLGKLLKRFSLTSKNNQKIIEEAQNDYSIWSNLKSLLRGLELKNLVGQQTSYENS